MLYAFRRVRIGSAGIGKGLWSSEGCSLDLQELGTTLELRLMLHLGLQDFMKILHIPVGRTGLAGTGNASLIPEASHWICRNWKGVWSSDE